MPAQSQNYRLKAEFLQTAKAIKLSAVNSWHKRVCYGRGISPTTWSEMVRGGVVGVHAVQVLARYLNRYTTASGSKPEVYDAGQHTVAAIADATSDRASAAYRAIDFWKLRWDGLLAAKSEWQAAGVDDCAAVPHDEADVDQLTDLVITSTGRRALAAGRPGGQAATDRDALAAGENFFGRRATEIASWHRSLWHAQPRTTMYSVSNAGGRATRCGATVMIPLAAPSFCAGKLSSFDIGPRDIEYPSKYVLIHSVADGSSPLPDRVAHNAQMVTGLYQLAMLTPLVLATGRFPRLACLEAFPDNTRRSRTFGFVTNGSIEPGAGGRVAVLLNPLRRGSGGGRHVAQRVLSYGAFCGTLVICQSLYYSSYQRAMSERPPGGHPG